MGKRFLLIDDDIASRNGTADLVARLGHKVVCRASGKPP